MAAAEKAYYIQSFNHAMSHYLNGQTYAWESYNSKGTITPKDTYVSKSKSLCRNYVEEFTIGTYSGKQQGVTCKRNGKAGWCRLKPDNAETCAMENRTIDLTFGELNVGSVDLGSIQLGNVELSIPVPDAGGIGDVGTPDMPDAPDSKNFDFLPDDPQKRKSNIDWLTN